MRARPKVVDRVELLRRLNELRDRGVKIVFTNGCFDVLHVGHVHYLYEAKSAGDVLVVGVNNDESVRRLKGAGRPTVPAEQRAEVLAALEMVDLVTIFDEDTPLELIQLVGPAVLVKGADWAPDQVVGRAEVEAAGGTVLLVPIRPGVSTTGILQRARST
jgi:D-beta-D-heptose 7-phosphate kinase/D-beta-D-heptose 1-phosphate adenosyltransferase